MLYCKGYERNNHNVDFELSEKWFQQKKKALFPNKFFKFIFWSVETKLLSIPHFIEKKKYDCQKYVFFAPFRIERLFEHF